MDVFDEGGAPELQQFVLLAQSARGAACAALIRQVLAHPKVFVFGELLAVRNVRELAGTEHTPALALLNTFAYGTWSDLAPAMAATLDLPMALKLKKLTVVSMCASEEVIAYDVLQKAAAIDSVRELEDLLISLIYEGLLRGKLDQRSKHIKVAHAIARDVHPDELPRLAAKLQAWCAPTPRCPRARAPRCPRATRRRTGVRRLCFSHRVLRTRAATPRHRARRAGATRTLG